MNAEINRGNVAEIADVMNEKYGWTKKDGKDAVVTVCAAIREMLMNGTEVGIKGFGTFTLNKAEARTYHNPASGEAIEKPERIIPKFKISNTLKKEIMDSLN